MISGPESQLDAVFTALADATRRRMLARLVQGDQTVGTLAQPFDMTVAAVSKHLQILLRAGLISQTRSGRETICRAEAAGVHPALIWLEACGQLGADDHSAIERLLAATMDDEDLLNGGIFDPEVDFD